MTMITPTMRLNQLLAQNRLVSPSMLESSRQAEMMRGPAGASVLEAGRTVAGEPPQTFVQTLGNAIESINEQQVDADQMAARFVAGEVENVHDAMVSMEKASLSFKFMVEVRAKLLEGYNELMRMQV